MLFVAISLPICPITFFPSLLSREEMWVRVGKEIPPLTESDKKVLYEALGGYGDIFFLRLFRADSSSVPAS